MIPRRPWRRRLARAALCLLLGAVTTVGVAWGCVLRDPAIDSQKAAQVVIAGSFFECVEDRGFGVTQRWVRRGKSMSERSYVGTPIQAGLHDLAVLALTEYSPEHGWPQTSLGRRMQADNWGRLEHDTWSIATGWPMRAVWGHGVIETSDRYGLVDLHWPGRNGERLLPLLPIWPGFVIDTLFYAAPWWMLFVAPSLVKRWRRKRLGRCVACGYDLRGLAREAACPECGG